MRGYLEKAVVVLILAVGFGLWQHHASQERDRLAKAQKDHLERVRLEEDEQAKQSQVEEQKVAQQLGLGSSQSPQRTHDAGMSTFGFDICAGRKVCALVFVAPWCPSCNKAAPTYRHYLSNADREAEIGIQLIVGAGKTAADNAAAARDFGKGAVADQNRRVQRQLGVKRFPSYFVLNLDRAVVLRGDAASQWIESKFH